MSFSEIFRDLRKEKSYSQQFLAEKLGTTRSTVSDWETERSEPSISQLLKISNFFGCSIDYLLGAGETNNTTLSALNENEQKLLKAFVLLNKEEQEKLITDAEFYSKRNK